MYCVQCLMCIIKCKGAGSVAGRGAGAVGSVYCVVCSVYCVVCSVQCIVCHVHCAVHYAFNTAPFYPKTVPRLA